MPFAEYAGFLLYLNRKHDTEKLQKLQNKALRLCFEIQNPRDISIADLHLQPQLSPLQERREMQLLGSMYDISGNERYVQNPRVHTQQADKITFCTEIEQYDIYRRSPYYVGSNLWSDLPV